jgi:putative ABC transport system permease protein
MSFKIAFLNIRKSLKDYSIYFFTLTFGVILFYAFNSIESQQAMFDMKESTKQAMKMFSQVIGAVSIFVSFILGGLIIYANNFLIKRRKEEFGIYLTLGMEKSRVMKILLIETSIIGLFSIVVGSLLGVFFSQGMALISATLFEAKISSFVFVFSKSALLKTLLYFSIIFAVVGIFNVVSVYRQKLIKLIRANRQNENIKYTNPAITAILIFSSFMSLGIAYYLLLKYGLEKSYDKGLIFIEMALAGIGTFLFFDGFSGFFLEIIRTNKRFYFKDLNTFVSRQIAGRINTSIFSMTIVSILLFFTISLLSAGGTMRNIINKYVETVGVHDIRFDSFENNEESILERLKSHVPEAMKYIGKYAEFELYVTDITFFQMNSSQPNIKMFATTISNLNNINKSMGKNSEILKNREIGIAYHGQEGERIAKEFLKGNKEIKDYKISKLFDLKGIGVTRSAKNIFLVYPDENVSELKYLERAFIAFYEGNKEISEANITKALENKFKIEIPSGTSVEKIKEIYPLYGIHYKTKTQAIAGIIATKAAAVYVAIYLGLIFMLASAVILALQQLSEAQDNKERYQVLSKIGVDSYMINKALFNQIGICFGVPLILAVIHSVFAISALNEMIAQFEKTEVLTGMLYTAAFILVIYGSYFMITYYGAKKIIAEHVREE